MAASPRGRRPGRRHGSIRGGFACTGGGGGKDLRRPPSSRGCSSRGAGGPPPPALATPRSSLPLLLRGAASNIIHRDAVVFASHRRLVVVASTLAGVEIQPASRSIVSVPVAPESTSAAPAAAAVPKRPADAPSRSRIPNPREPTSPPTGSTLPQVDVVHIRDGVPTHIQKMPSSLPIYPFTFHRRSTFSHPGRIFI